MKVRTFEEYIAEGERWKKFMKMLTDFNDRMNLNTDFDYLEREAKWAAAIAKDPKQKAQLKDFAAALAKADMSSVQGRQKLVKLEKDILPIFKALNLSVRL